VILIVESYLGLCSQFCRLPQEDVGRCGWSVGLRVITKTKVYSTPTRLEFWGVGLGREVGKTGG